MSDPRELVDEYAYSYADCDGECTHDCDDHRGRQAPKVFTALRAVLRVHQGERYGDVRICHECSDGRPEAALWPCTTAQAIVDAMEVV